MSPCSRKIRHFPSGFSLKFNKLWVGAEIILFVLVGATVDLRYLKSAGGTAVLLLLLVLLFRMSGVFLCLAGTDLTKKNDFSA